MFAILVTLRRLAEFGMGKPFLDDWDDASEPGQSAGYVERLSGKRGSRSDLQSETDVLILHDAEFSYPDGLAEPLAGTGFTRSETEMGRRIVMST